MHSENLRVLPEILAGAPVLALRLATPDDEPRQRELFACLRSLTPPLPTALLEQQWRLRQQVYGSRYPQARTWMLEVDDEPVGCLTLNLCDTALRIIDIGLWPHWQGRGLGRRVLQAVLILADSQGLPTELAVLRHNPAVQLYRRLGFTECFEQDVDLSPAPQLEMLRPAS